MKRREFNRRLLWGSASTAVHVPLTAFAPLQSKPPNYTINSDRLRESLEALSQFGRNPEGGVSRVAWTGPDIEARRFVIDTLMARAGLKVRIDPAGSIYGRRDGKDGSAPVILFGSHIDSVPKGGNFNGDVGSMAAIEIMRTLHEKKIETRHPLECVIWSNEEGVHYGRGLFGSRATVGEFEPGEFEERDEAGVHIRDAVRGIGGDLARIREALRKPGEIAVYLELHIEQGGLLDHAGVPIGVVEGIVGINRYHVRVKGFANHAGTTPMPERRDALVAASQLIIAVREETVREPGRQVGTVGKLSVAPGAPNIIPGEVELVIELRDLSLEKVETIFARIQSRANEIALRAAPALKYSAQAPISRRWPPGGCARRLRGGGRVRFEDNDPSFRSGTRRSDACAHSADGDDLRAFGKRDKPFAAGIDPLGRRRQRLRGPSSNRAGHRPALAYACVEVDVCFRRAQRDNAKRVARRKPLCCYRYHGCLTSRRKCFTWDRRCRWLRRCCVRS